MTAGRAFVLLLLLVGGVGTFVDGAVFYVRMFYTGLLLLVFAWWLAITSLRGVRVERKARSLRAAVGDVFEEHFDIVNSSRTFKIWLEVANETTIPYARGSRVLTLISPKQKRSYTARTWLTARGAFPLGPTRISSGDPFGVFRVSKVFPANESLVVLPMLFNVASFLSPPGLLPGGQVIRRKSQDVTPHAAGVREYVAGDPLKRIHWPTSVRRGRLMVKEFEQDPQSEMWLFLDAYQSAHVAKAGEVFDAPPTDDLFLLKRRKIKLAPSTLEYSISAAASLAHYFIAARRSVGLITASGRTYKVIPAERSERQEAKIFEALAFIRAESLFTLPALVTAQLGQLPQGSSAILVTPTIYPELLIAVDSLQRRNLRPVVVLMMTLSFGSRASNEDLAKSLEERRVPVCRVHCDEDLGVTLSTFYSQINSQDTSWRKPVLSHLT
ncbi:MAG: DUF58 domain-containing protein [Anaerolineales bacterium]|nr:DUF58 domain-containing protein [Anaerolineales bacterium]